MNKINDIAPLRAAAHNVHTIGILTNTYIRYEPMKFILIISNNASDKNAHNI